MGTVRASSRARSTASGVSASAQTIRPPATVGGVGAGQADPPGGARAPAGPGGAARRRRAPALLPGLPRRGGERLERGHVAARGEVRGVPGAPRAGAAVVAALEGARLDE